MAAVEREKRPVVAQVSYSFFHSTQSFIHFTVSRLRSVRPIGLTRTPESPLIARSAGPREPGDLHLYGGGRALEDLLWKLGWSARRGLTRLPPALSEPALRALNRAVVPRARQDADPLRFLAWARSILEQRRARLIHAWFGPVGWRMLALRRALGIPLVVTFLGDDIAPKLGDWWSWWIRTEAAGAVDWPARLAELLRESDLVLVEGPHARQRLLALGCPPEKLHIQRIAIPVEDVPFRARRPRPGRRTRILFAGRFCEQKGVLHALAAARELRKSRRDFELRLIGDETMTDGAYAARVYDTVRRERLADWVTLRGFLSYADYLAELDEADVFLHPSVVTDDGASEGGAPTTILEAQAAGLPVVSTQHCDIPWVTVPGRSAILVPERDVGALVRALGTLLDEGDRWEAYGRAGRAHVARFHAAEKVVPDLEERYRALLCASGRS